MNIYARFFNEEILVRTKEELFDFLNTLPDINCDEAMKADLQRYLESENRFPKRYKVRPRVYFIIIKTTAENLDEFREKHKSENEKDCNTSTSSPQASRDLLVKEERTGWYKGTINFKRVVRIPDTGKFQYQDTTFEAFVVANSAINCYNRIIAYLRNRPDIDARSQFPSAKGSNFQYEYIGEALPKAIIPRGAVTAEQFT